MDSIFSDRIADVPRSFIREILKVALDHTYISFAGGLPNRDLFPIAELQKAAAKVFDAFGKDVLQYSPSEGFDRLKEIIARRYLEKTGVKIPIDEILITTGSQQGLDLLGKSLINDGDPLVIEEPGYLGAIQAFSLYKPRFLPVPVSDDGMDVSLLKKAMSRKPKLMYTVPNFSNPSGISYPEANRHAVAEIIDGSGAILAEDDPYGEIRFSGSPKPSFKTLLPNNTVLLGTFSKIIAPGFRLGWLAAPPAIMEKLIVAKQAADLNTTYYLQALVYQYLQDNDIEAHIRKIRDVYGRQLGAMLDGIRDFFPPGVSHTHPEGGMFIWAALPEGRSSRKLLDIAVKDKVIFVPGDPFYVNRRETNTMRLNFSCTDEAATRTGMERLGRAVKTLLRE